MRLFDCRKLLPFGGLVLFFTIVVYGAASKGTAAVRDLSFDSNGSSVEVKISASAGARYTYFELHRPARLVVDFHDLQDQFPFKEKSIQAAGVERVRTAAFIDKKRNVTRVVFDLNRPVPYRFQEGKDGLVTIVFGDSAKTAAPQIAETTPRPSAAPSPTPVVERAVPPAVRPASKPVELASLEPITIPVAETAPEHKPSPARVRIPASFQTVPTSPSATTQTDTAQPQYTGEVVSFDLTNTSFTDFFRLIQQVSGLNIILDRNVNGTIPALILNDVPWDQALDVVLKNNQLGAELQGNVLRIATLDTIQKEQDAKNKLRDAIDLSAPLETHTYVLNYEKASDVQATLTKMLSSRGTVLPDPRRNALIVTDIPSRFSRIDSTVKFMDVPAQQVEIEARILSANKSFSRDIGSQLGMILGNGHNNQITGVGATGAPVTGLGGQSLPLVSNLPAAATSGLSLLSGAGGDVILDALITAAEASGTAKVISRPRVVTQNNQPATVSNGTQIPVQTNVNNTVSVQFITFALKLTVTPQITDVGTILMTVNVENSQPDFAQAVNGIPSVATQSTQTQYLIQDGGTQTIGGILVDTDTLNVRQVPGIGSIPLIGNLFKETSMIKSTTELLFFITARILPSDNLGIRNVPPEASQPKSPQQHR